ncbi:hypothetical protein [Ancylobacter terrae]|uniref:hypothetical protein n=1 Tax=Ancylobacter sp. sgz301288 TaxID=3342077 RepID=UPI00385D521E
MIRTALTLIVLFAVLVAACVAFGGYFAYGTLVGAYRDVLQSRFAISTERIAAAAERAGALGIALRSQTTLPALLAQEAGLDPLVRRIEVHDEARQRLFSSDAGGGAAGGIALARPIRTDTGRVAGEVVLVYDPVGVEVGAAALWDRVRFYTLLAVVFAVVATLAAGLALALTLRRAVARASDAATWPEPARRALVDADAVHADVARRLEADAVAAGGHGSAA